MNNLFDYKQELDALRFTPEQKAALAASAAKAAGQAARRKRRPILRTGLIAAAMAAALVAGAGASGVLKTAAEVFAPIFGGTAAQTEVIDKIGYPIGAGDTDNGVTITADAIMGDKYNAAIVYTIRRDDGTPLFPEEVDPRDLLVGGTGGATLNVLGGVHGSSWFVDEDPADDSIQMVQTLTSDRPVTGCTAAAEFSGLCVWDDASGTAVPVVEGYWSFRFDVDYEDSSVSLGGGETFQQGGLTFTITEVTVSPIAVQVAYEVDHEVVWSDAPSGRADPADSRQVERYMENVEILLTKTDGTVLTVGSGGSIKPANGKTVCTKGGTLEEIIPLEELSSISVGGVVYPISGD